MEEPKTVRKLQYNEQETVWFSHSAGVVTVGLTQKALDDIGGAEDVRLPDEGQELDEGDGAVEIEGPEGEFVVLAPLGGRVVEVNSTLESVTSALNEDPDAEGWLFRMEVEDEEDLG